MRSGVDGRSVTQGSQTLFLESLALTLIKLTHLCFSNDPEDAQVCLIRVRDKLCRNGPDLRMPGLTHWSQIEIDRYIGLPIFLPLFKHFTIIGYRF